MKQKKNTGKLSDSNTTSGKKTKGQLISKESFNTDSHTPSSLRKVGPGYDDTGLGDYAKNNDMKDKDVNNRQSKKIRKTRGNSA